MASAPDDLPASTAPPPPQPTKPFRFKRKRPSSPSLSASDERRRKRQSSDSPHRSHRHHRHHHHHRSRRRPRTPVDDPTSYDDTYLPNARSKNYNHPNSLDPDTAFRESLFDALADDEGAAFWEGVYGQPIHNYSPYKTEYEEADQDPENPKLERMSDEEYVGYVRGKMWEKSHQCIIEERRKREAQRKERKVKEEEGRKWQTGVEEALRRGEERRKRDKWKGVWANYLSKWETTFSSGEGSMRDRISWPVESGKWIDVGTEEVERFFRHSPQAAAVKSGGEVDFANLLKKERVRWHPDKMQQRAGSAGIDEGTRKVVTAVFQVVDRLWSENKERV